MASFFGVSGGQPTEGTTFVEDIVTTVSYTHLTLPTILLV